MDWLNFWKYFQKSDDERDLIRRYGSNTSRKDSAEENPFRRFVDVRYRRLDDGTFIREEIEQEPVELTEHISAGYYDIGGILNPEAFELPSSDYVTQCIEEGINMTTINSPKAKQKLNENDQIQVNQNQPQNSQQTSDEQSENIKDLDSEIETIDQSQQEEIEQQQQQQAELDEDWEQVSGWFPQEQWRNWREEIVEQGNKGFQTLQKILWG
eukprot:TRINITY_DN4429_c0_g1_i1.p2 TRINITY_DN4429_c0_g1~~TRINITY_DN4429_c0_g1_i1.p2  ORF type:complete len:246 (-),score=33.00 TRINITY_DN4429_c0_g1_i1:994-1629(-)